MIKIVLKSGEQLPLDAPLRGIDALFEKMDYLPSSNEWFKMGNYILPADEILYIQDMGDGDDD